MKLLYSLIILLLISINTFVNCQLLTDVEKTLLINKHNEWRSKPNGPVPSTKITPLTYDDTIADKLVKSLRKCDYSYSDMKKYGQNSEWQVWVEPKSSFNLSKILENIQDSSKNYDWSSKGCTGSSSNCNIWTNAVWNKTKSFGCAKSYCDDLVELSCSYYPAGGFKGVNPYSTNQTQFTTLATDTPTKPDTTTDSIDWSDYITPVRDQNECKSDWAFAAISAMESRYLIKNETIKRSELKLSVQNAINCISGSCQDGWAPNVFQYFDSKGIAYEKDQPFDGVDKDCDLSDKVERLKIKGYGSVEKSKQSLINELKNGPITIALFADTKFQSYSGGIYDSSDVYTQVNHVVLLTGYDKSTDSWIIKNSFGPSWGINGFGRITASNDNLAILAFNSHYPKF